MKIRYDDQDDVLRIEFSSDRIVKDVSFNWNVNAAYGDRGIVEITILDAKARGFWPPENAAELIKSAA